LVVRMYSSRFVCTVGMMTATAAGTAATTSTVTAWIADGRPACYSWKRMNTAEFAACTWYSVVLLVMISATRIRRGWAVAVAAATIAATGSTVMVGRALLPTSAGTAMLAVRTMTASQAVVAMAL
jgi:hypothetical protein